MLEAGLAEIGHHTVNCVGKLSGEAGLGCLGCAITQYSAWASFNMGIITVSEYRIIRRVCAFSHLMVQEEETWGVF